MILNHHHCCISDLQYKHRDIITNKQTFYNPVLKYASSIYRWFCEMFTWAHRVPHSAHIYQ